MFIHFVSLSIFITLSILNICTLFSPVFISFALIVGKVKLKMFFLPLLLMAYLSTLIIFLLILFYFTLDFYLGISFRNATQKMLPYNKTRYSAIIKIVYDEIMKYITCESKEIDIYIIKDDNKKIFSISCLRKGGIVLTSGIMDFVLHEMENDDLSPLLALQGVFIHEISHIENADNITGDFIKINTHFTKLIISFYKLLLNMMQKVTSLIPIPYFKGALSFAFSKAGSYLLNAVSIFNTLMESLHYLLKRTIFQIHEKRCDANIKKAIGEGPLSAMLNFFGSYNNYYSHHIKNSAKRLEVGKKQQIFEDLPYLIGEKQKKHIFTGIIIMNLLLIALLAEGIYLQRHINLMPLLNYLTEKERNFYGVLYSYFNFLKRSLFYLKDLFK